MDPSRLAPDADIKRNQARFEKLIGRLMSDITSSAPRCPVYAVWLLVVSMIACRAMKLIYDYIQEETVKRFPNMRYKVLGGFFFLR